MGTARAFILVNAMADPANQSLSNCAWTTTPLTPVALYMKLYSVTNWVKLACIKNTAAKMIGLRIAKLHTYVTATSLNRTK